MPTKSTPAVKAEVRKAYAHIASSERPAGCCSPGCCQTAAGSNSSAIGYSEEERQSVPAGTDLGLGCGNPQAIAELKPGERVLDLGSGAGFDAFLAARQVGPHGSVVGVDMTPEMVVKARANLMKMNLQNVAFRLGEIEQLPLTDESVDVIISNCVVNLSPDKPAVFREAFRVLIPGGRLAIADIVAWAALPDAIRDDVEAYAGCVAGAAQVSEVHTMLREAGFEDVHVELARNAGRQARDDWTRGFGTQDFVSPALIRAKKPGVVTRRLA
jgi:SAM-dependent methyltransferase